MKISRKNLIYVLRDCNDNVRYVGQTIRGKFRFKDHVRKRNRKQPVSCFLKKCIDQKIKYRFEIIEYCPKSILDDREIFYIKYYRNLGCNLLNLTDGGSTTKGYKHTKEALKVMSDNQKGTPSNFKGRKHTEETKRIFSYKASLRTGNLNNFYGKKHSEESKNKMSETKKRMFKDKTLIPHNLRPILCLYNMKTYNNSREAAEDLNVPSSSIRSVLQGKSRVLYGKYKFIYKEDYDG